MSGMVKRITQLGAIFLICFGFFYLQPASAGEGNIDGTHKYAWSENTGWENFKPTHGGVTVNDTHLSGYAWAGNIGWVKFGSGTGPYANTTSANWGVNLDSAMGTLSGYAWSENTGWINFNVTDENSNGVSIDKKTLEFDGYAWAENVGYIHFHNASPEYYVMQEATAPRVSTQSVSSITATSAMGNGNVTDLGVPDPTQHGVCWSKLQSPTTNDTKTELGAMSLTGAFTSSIIGLEPETKYYVRAYATNIGDTSYGEEVSFTTLPNPPTAPNATAATFIAETSFTANWNAAKGAIGYRLDVATDSGFLSLVFGYENKDVGNVTTISVTGLSAITEYYYRVRACNEGGNSENSSTISLTTTDGTGIPAEIQDAAPNSGDGNGDGSKDSLQTGVASLPCASPGGSYLTVSVAGCGQLEAVQAYTYESAGKPDPGYEYLFDLVGFIIPCTSATVRIYYHGANGLNGYTYRKFGPTPEDWNLSIWYDMPGVNFGTKVIGGVAVPYVEFVLTEAQLGDDTPIFPIIDQGGVVRANAIPTLNEWGMISLGLLMAGLAVWAIRKREV